MSAGLSSGTGESAQHTVGAQSVVACSDLLAQVPGTVCRLIPFCLSSLVSPVLGNAACMGPEGAKQALGVLGWSLQSQYFSSGAGQSWEWAAPQDAQAQGAGGAWPSDFHIALGLHGPAPEPPLSALLCFPWHLGHRGSLSTPISHMYRCI